MSKPSSSTQTGRPRPNGTGIDPLAEARDQLQARRHERAHVVEAEAAVGRRRTARASSTATAPTCMGVSGRSRWRKRLVERGEAVVAGGRRRPATASHSIGASVWVRRSAARGRRHDVTPERRRRTSRAPVEERHRLGGVGERLLVAPDAQAHGHELELVGALVEERDPLLDRDARDARVVAARAAPRWWRAGRRRSASSRALAVRSSRSAVAVSRGTSMRATERFPAPAQLAGLPRVVASREALVAPAASGDHHHQPTARGTELRLREHLCPSAPPSGAGYRAPLGSVLCRACPAPRRASGASTPTLVLALDARLGPPVDSYLNGAQTWITDDGPGEIGLEWRLHPVAGYRLPRGLSHYDLWEQVVARAVGGRRPGRADARVRDRARCGRSGTVWSASRRTATTWSRRRSRRRRPTRSVARPTPPGSSTTRRSAPRGNTPSGTTSIVEMVFAELNTDRHPR